MWYEVIVHHNLVAPDSNFRVGRVPSAFAEVDVGLVNDISCPLENCGKLQIEAIDSVGFSVGYLTLFAAVRRRPAVRALVRGRLVADCAR